MPANPANVLLLPLTKAFSACCCQGIKNGRINNTYPLFRAQNEGVLSTKEGVSGQSTAEEKLTKLLNRAGMC